MYGKYTCLDCGETFNEPHRYVERHGLPTPPYERWSVCPLCGGDYAPTLICDGCGGLITDEYVQIGPSGKRFCNRCFSLRRLTENTNFL